MATSDDIKDDMMRRAAKSLTQFSEPRMESAPAKSSMQAKLRNETREFFVLTAYLFVCFAAVAYMKFAILKAQGVDFAPFAFAIVKAAICAKFVLLGRALPIERRFPAYPLVVPTIFRTFAFLVVVVILMFVEGAIVGLFHGRPISVSIAETSGSTEERIARPASSCSRFSFPILRSARSATSWGNTPCINYSLLAIVKAMLDREVRGLRTRSRTGVRHGYLVT